MEIDFAPTIEENGIKEEVVATSECSGRIELESASTLTSKERITIIKEQAMSTPNLSVQVNLGSVSTLMTKEVLGSTPLTKEVTITLKLLSQEEQGTTITPTY